MELTNNFFDSLSSKIGAKGLNDSLNLVFKLSSRWMLCITGFAKMLLFPNALGPNSILPSKRATMEPFLRSLAIELPLSTLSLIYSY